MKPIRCRMCGGQAIPTSYRTSFTNDIKTYSCYCERCNTQIGMFETGQEAAEFWNKLMGVTLDELREFCDATRCQIESCSSACAIYMACDCKDEWCKIDSVLMGRDKIEKAVMAWRDEKSEKV